MIAVASVSPSPRAHSDYARVERAILFLQANARRQPSLAEVAAHVGLSEFHFQRLFHRFAGVTPKRFLQLVTVAEARRLLAETRSLLDVSLEVGLSGPGRLHDLFLSVERMTPGEYKAQARGLVLRWSIAETPLGEVLLATLDRGLCGVGFLDAGGERSALADLRTRWPGARLERDDRALSATAAELRARLAGRLDRPLSLVLRGTPLQLRVWEALLRIPSGHLLSYGDLARVAGVARATRAVATAVGENPIAWLIPCHRVIRATGALGDYRWGAARKAVLFARERQLPLP